MAQRKKFRHKVERYFLPHSGNRYMPGIFARQSVAAIALALLLIEAAYFVQTKIVLNIEGFTATVLPAALTDLANADRAAYALASLEPDAELARAAQRKADDMATRGYFSHVAPDGATFRQILDSEGYSYTYAGENLAVDFSESIAVESAWMNSPTHRANILKAEYTHVGYGVARGMYQGRDVTFVAQFLAAKPGRIAAVAPVEEGNPAAQGEAPVAIANGESQTQVLGQEVRSAAVQTSAVNSVAVLATSPTRVLMLMLTAFTALVALLFSITVVAHIRNKYLYLEVLAGGVVILVLGVGLLVFNGMRKDGGNVPPPSQAASVSAIL